MVYVIERLVMSNHVSNTPIEVRFFGAAFVCATVN
jgi:hypothetical protein